MLFLVVNLLLHKYECKFKDNWRRHKLGHASSSSSSSSSSSVDRWTQVVNLYVQSVVYHSEYRTIRIQ